MKSDKIHGAAFVALLVILFWAPLPFASNVLWAEMLLCVLLFTLTFMVVAQRLAKGEPLIPGHTTQPFCLALLSLVCAQLYLCFQLVPAVFAMEYFSGSIDPHATTVMLLSGLALCCTFYLVRITVTTEARANFLMLTLVACGVFQASYGTVMTLSGLEYSFFMEKNTYRGVATGTFINRNHLAGYLVLTLACGIGLMIAGFQRRQYHSLRDFLRSFVQATISGKGALRIGLIIMVIGLVLTRSRMGNASFFIALGLSGALILMHSNISKKAIAAFIVSIFVIDALIISAFFDLDKLAERLETTTAQTENRDEIFQLSVPLIKDHILTGTGAGTFYTAYPQYRDATAGDGFYVHAHNDYVEFLSERGVFGVLPLIIFFCLCLKEAVRLLRSRSSRRRGLAFTLLMTMMAIVMHSAVDFNLQMPAYALTLIAIWALGFTRPYLSRTTAL